jgi:site-specific DNA-cytosine methylase
MVAAGWPCQDYSPAGVGIQGTRAALMADVTRILRLMQSRHRDVPIGYLLENVAMQHNFRHEHIRNPVYERVLESLGQAVTFDATRAGSHAHRLRNYWTNLAEPKYMQAVLSKIQVPHTKTLDQLLEPGRFTKEVTTEEKTVSGLCYNKVGQPRITFPTLMSFPSSRAFKTGQKGSIFDSNLNIHDEPSAEERERIMGFQPSSTAAPGVSESQRRSLLGQAMDLNALLLLLLTAEAITERPPPAKHSPVSPVCT